MRLGKNSVRFSAAICAVIIGFGAAGLTALPAGAAGSGSISGRVVDGGGNPLANICVAAAGQPGIVTDPSGLYSLTGLGSGDYAVQYWDCNPSPTFVTQWFQGRSDQGSADPVTVVDPADTPLPDVTMAPGVVVQGTVTDTGGNPVANVNVNVNANGPGQGASAPTAPDGTYSTSPLPTGSYKVQFSPTDPQYAQEYWNDRPTWGMADLLNLDVGNGPVQGGIDAQLAAAAATIEGTVTDTSSTPLAGICVASAVPNGGGGWDTINGTNTLGDGTYSLTALPAVDVRVQFRDSASGPYIEQWYSGAPDFNSSTPIVLASGDLRQGIDAQLNTGTSVSGTVTDGLGNPIPNVNVNVNPTGPGASAFGQTNPAGQYTTTALPPGTYTVQFQGTPAFAGEYWNDKLTPDDADVVTVTGSDGPVIGNIDAVLAAGANVSGTVTDSNGQPIGNVCVDAGIDTSNGITGINGTATAPNGTYTLNGLPPTTVKILFRDCNGVGPYVSEWWNDAPNSDAATPLALAPGENRTGIDAQLAPAGAITGTVTNGGGNPLGGICVQASTTTAVGGMGRTDSNGQYTVILGAAGDYKVQFVDCDGAAYAGEWWNDQPSAATAQTVHVAAGAVVPGIDAVLAPGATGSVSGRAINAHGTAMTTACVVVYLPYEFALFAPVGPDGSYTVPNVPSGTYAVAFLGCPSGGEPGVTVPDPDISGIDYSTFWWNGVRLDLSGSGNTTGGPDPVAQGADLVTVTPGQNVTGIDACFGCTAIVILSITPGPNSLTVAFTTPNPSAAGGLSVSASVPVTYTVTCSSPSGGVTGSASGPGSPITVSGLTSGASYFCQVAAAAGGVIFATSAVSDVLAAGTTASGGGDDADPPSAPVTGSLPRTGATSATTLARAGFVLLMLGLVLTVTNRRRRRALFEAD